MYRTRENVNLISNAVIWQIWSSLVDVSKITASAARSGGYVIPRSSGYVIPMSVMADMLTANDEKRRNLIYNVLNGNKHGAAIVYHKDTFRITDPDIHLRRMTYPPERRLKEVD